MNKSLYNLPLREMHFSKRIRVEGEIKSFFLYFFVRRHRFMFWIVILKLTSLLFSLGVEAGMNKFTLLDRVDDWIVERYVDSSNNSIRCRASIPGVYSWFGGRIRLNEEGELVTPPGLPETEIPSQLTIAKLRKGLKACASSLIYIPLE